jgi:hypothetical protein
MPSFMYQLSMSPSWVFHSAMASGGFRAARC